MCSLRTYTTPTIPMSYRQILYQIVFATKYRQPTIDDAHCNELYRYIWGAIKNKNCKLFQINGVEEHIHILCDLHPSLALADLVKDINVSSSLWMKACGLFPDFIGWAEGYGAFTYSIRQRDVVINSNKTTKRAPQAGALSGRIQSPAGRT